MAVAGVKTTSRVVETMVNFLTAELIIVIIKKYTTSPTYGTSQSEIHFPSHTHQFLTSSHKVNTINSFKAFVFMFYVIVRIGPRVDRPIK